jgi:type VI secretion system secreted protein Hcp
VGFLYTGGFRVDRVKNAAGIYMNWGGTMPPEIRGDVTAPDHIGWIELFSAQFGVGRGLNQKTGDVESSPTVSEIVVTKAMDIASAALAKECIHGEGKKVVIDFVKTINGKPKVYHTMTLSSVTISNCNVSPPQSGGVSGPTEAFSLSFKKVENGPATGVQPHTTPLPNQNPAFWNIRPPAR